VAARVDARQYKTRPAPVFPSGVLQGFTAPLGPAYASAEQKPDTLLRRLCKYCIICLFNRSAPVFDVARHIIRLAAVEAGRIIGEKRESPPEVVTIHKVVGGGC